MSGLRFESMADMPPRMRELYARQQIDLSGAAAPAPLHKGSRGNTKYHNERAKRAGIRFDSQKEARRYDELMVMLRAGIISDLRLQPQFTLQESYITEPASASAQCGTRRTFRTNSEASSLSRT